MLYSILSTIFSGIVRVLTRLEVRGAANIPIQGSLLVVANHIHYIDPPLLGAIAPRKVVFMAKADLFRVPFLGLLVRAYDAFAVRRGEGDTYAIRHALKVLRNGQALAMFPEGTRSKSGALQPARLGAAMLALRTGSTVIPVGISGTRSFLRWPEMLRRPRVIVHVGEPFEVEHVARPTRLQQTELAERMMRGIAALLPPEQRGPYAALPEPDQPARDADVGAPTQADDQPSVVG